MASLKEVKTRINSVKSTRKITSAMKMVASAKLHKAQGAIENMLPYQKKLNKILTNFLSADLPIESPYVQEREVKRVAIVVFSSNTCLLYTSDSVLSDGSGQFAGSCARARGGNGGAADAGRNYSEGGTGEHG